MPKALFFNIPAHGHITPSLPLVQELVRRGHEIVYYTTESYRQKIEATGVSTQIYDSVADDFFDSRGLDGKVPHLAAKALLTTTKAILPQLIEAVNSAKPDYIIYDCMCPWGYYVAKIMKLPSVSSASLMPLAPRVILKPQVLRLFLPPLIKGLRASNDAMRLAQGLGEQYDVRPLTRVEFLNAPGDLIISYSSAAYVPLADTLPDNVKFVGWNWQESASDDSFVHDSPRPLIYISLGTVANENLAFFQICVAALADTLYAVLISTGGRFSVEQFGMLPGNITIKAWVPQTQVLEQASLFITHGGLNSVHEGLYCGLPLLVVPQQAEQTFNGLRVAELGAGLMLRPHEVTDTALRDRVTALLSDVRYRAAADRLSQSLRTAGGVERAAEEIEALLKRSR